MTQAVASYPLFAVNLLSHALDKCVIFELFNDALADLLGLITYRHGTSASSFYSIMWTGGQPRLGGRPDRGENAADTAGGHNRETKGDWDTRGKFFVMNDTLTALLNGPCGCCEQLHYYENQKNRGSTFRNFAHNGELQLGGLQACNGYSTATLNSLTPLVKFRFTPEEAKAQQFRNDDTIGDTAQVTTQPITPDHLGLYGTLAHGLNCGAFQRAYDNPDRFVRGLYKLAWAVMLTALIVLGFTLSPITALLVSAFLVYEAVYCIGNFVTPILAGSGNVPQLEELA